MAVAEALRDAGTMVLYGVSGVLDDYSACQADMWGRRVLTSDNACLSGVRFPDKASAEGVARFRARFTSIRRSGNRPGRQLSSTWLALPGAGEVLVPGVSQVQGRGRRRCV